MATVTVQRLIDAPVEKVWDSWDNFGDIYKFNPNLNHSHLLEGSKPSGKGARRQCDINDGENWIREEVVEYIPYQSMTIDIFEGTMPLKRAIATFDFKEISPNRTEVTMNMEFELKMGILGKLMLPIMKSKFKGMLNALLEGNDAFVTRGLLANAA